MLVSIDESEWVFKKCNNAQLNLLKVSGIVLLCLNKIVMIEPSALMSSDRALTNFKQFLQCLTSQIVFTETSRIQTKI